MHFEIFFKVYEIGDKTNAYFKNISKCVKFGFESTHFEKLFQNAFMSVHQHFDISRSISWRRLTHFETKMYKSQILDLLYNFLQTPMSLIFCHWKHQTYSQIYSFLNISN